MADLISRQEAIDALMAWEEDSIWDEECLKHRGEPFWVAPSDVVEQLPSAQPEQRWIPCSDVPDTDRNVFIARGEQDNMTACIGHYDHDNKQWYEDRNWFAKCLYDGLYWCEIPPLPEPWRGEEHERSQRN